MPWTCGRPAPCNDCVPVDQVPGMNGQPLSKEYGAGRLKLLKL